MMNEASLCWGNPIDAKLSKSLFRSPKNRNSSGAVLHLPKPADLFAEVEDEQK